MVYILVKVWLHVHMNLVNSAVLFTLLHITVVIHKRVQMDTPSEVVRSLFSDPPGLKVTFNRSLFNQFKSIQLKTGPWDNFY